MFRRKRATVPPLPAPHSLPALEEARKALAETISEADRRVDQILERLRAREEMESSK
jgi:F0F1-type ATP synthase membrane subunit b/b'